MSVLSQYHADLETIRAVMGEPSTDQERAEDHVARVVRDAFLATSELFALHLNPETSALVAKEEGEIWAMQGRIRTLLENIRGEHAA